MRVGDVCTRPVIQCATDTSALEIAQLMRTSHIGAVIVVDRSNGEHVAAGIVTDRDLVVQVMAEDADATRITAGELIRSPLITAADGDDVNDTLELMAFNGVRRIPVVNEYGTPVGIVTFDDLLKLTAGQLAALGKVIDRERFEEDQAR